MDDILRDGARRERKRELQLGVLLVGGGLAVALGMYALAWSAGGIVLVPTGAIALGLARIGRAVMRRPSRD